MYAKSPPLLQEIWEIFSVVYKNLFHFSSVFRSVLQIRPTLFDRRRAVVYYYIYFPSRCVFAFRPQEISASSLGFVTSALRTPRGTGFSPRRRAMRFPETSFSSIRLYERDNTNTIANIHIFRKSVKKNNDFFRPKIPPPSRKALFINILYIQLIVLKNDKGIVVGRGHGDTFGRQRNRPKRNGRQNCPKQKISRCNSATWRQTHLFHREGIKLRYAKQGN